MAKLQSAEQLKEYSYRKLGYPKVQIQVDDTQAYDRIDDALQMFVERHFDGVEEKFIPITFTANDETNGYLELSDNIVAVTRIHEPNTYSSEAMSDVRYRLMFDEMFNMTNVNMQYFEVTMQHLEMIGSYFSLDRTFSFNKANNRLYAHSGAIIEGNKIMIRAWRAVTPDEVNSIALDVYNDEWIKKYSTALIKQQWGANMKQYDGMPLPGGITVNGTQVWTEASEEIQKLEEEFSLTYELPTNFLVG